MKPSEKQNYLSSYAFGALCAMHEIDLKNASVKGEAPTVDELAADLATGELRVAMEAAGCFQRRK